MLHWAIMVISRLTMTSRRRILGHMKLQVKRDSPGQVRDTILGVLARASQPLSVTAICQGVQSIHGTTPLSSIRSYLLNNTPDRFRKTGRGFYELNYDRAD